jgi:2,4-dienoyl-CoA reductase-like NADH-dependent reductase (Old Yellow Enzyme family)
LWVTQALARPLVLPNGTTLSNRIAKAATSEALADRRTGQPTEGLVRLYERWGAGGAGLLITGNVVIDVAARTEPGNVVITDARDVALLRRWADAAQAGGAKLFLQINHAGRQTPRRINHRPVAPSAVAVRGKGGLFATPRALGDAEIVDIVGRFARSAQVAAEAGFAGVEIHAAHGYLLGQFLSPQTNLRSDRWGGSAAARMQLLLEIVRAVRGRVGRSLAIAVKLNSADFQRGGFSEDESMDVVTALEREAIDLLEISGGSYESSAMMGTGRDSTRSREAYFLDYAVKVRKTTGLPLMLTGGLRSAEAMTAALDTGAVDVLGMARPLVVEPDLPARLLRGEARAALDIAPRVGIQLFDDMLQILWYQRQLRRMGEGRAPLPELGRWSSLAVGFARNYAFNPLGALRPARRPVAQIAAASR